jgi:hypothetical protein
MNTGALLHRPPYARPGGSYTPDVESEDALFECKAWSRWVHGQFKRIRRLKELDGKKAVLVINLPDCFDELWVMANHNGRKVYYRLRR